MRKLLLPAAVPAMVVLGLVKVAPDYLKRRMAPPEQELPFTPADAGLDAVDVWLESVNGTRLHGWYIPVAGRAPAVVVLHGWGGNASLMLPLAPHLYRAGFHTFFLDARNHGLSECDDYSSMPRFAEDLEVALDWVAVRDEVTKVGVLGHSVGAGAAILVASRRDGLGAVVSVASFSDPREVMVDQTTLGRLPRPLRWAVLWFMERVVGHRFDDTAPQERIRRARAPVMLVHGEDDEVVPLSHLHHLAAAAPAARVLQVPGAGHSEVHAFEPHFDEVLGFLEAHLR